MRKNKRRIYSILLATALLINEVPVSVEAKSSDVKMSKTSLKLTVGQSQKLKVKKSAGITVKKVTFKTKDKKIASVSKKGVVKAKKKGSTKITVKVKYKKKAVIRTKKLTVKVKVQMPADSVSTTQERNTTSPATTKEQKTEASTKTEGTTAVTTEKKTEDSESSSEKTTEVNKTEASTATTEVDKTEASTATTEVDKTEASTATTEVDKTEASTETTEVDKTEASTETTEADKTEASTETTEAGKTEESTETTEDEEIASSAVETVLQSARVIYQAGDYDKAITKDLEFACEEEDSVKVSWTTNDLDVISAEGKVTRPLGNDCQVTITVTVEKGSVKQKKTFTVNVIAESEIQLEDVEAMSCESLIEKNENNEWFDVTTDDTDSYIRSLTGSFYDAPVVTAEDALCAIKSLGEMTGIEDVEKELQCELTTHDETGSVFRFQLYHEGIPVYGSSVILVTDAIDQACVLSSSYEDLSAVDVKPTITSEKAKEIVAAELSENGEVTNVELVIYNLTDVDVPILAYVVSTVDGASYEDYIVDAHTAKIENSFSTACNGFKCGEYSAKTETGEEVTLPSRIDGDTEYPYDDERKIQLINKGDKKLKKEEDCTMTSLYHNIIEVHDWWNKSANIDSLTDKFNGYLYVEVHARDGKDNGQWVKEEEKMQFFDNSGELDQKTDGKTFASSLDMIAHEYAHGIQCKLGSADMVGDGCTEPNAIAEGYSDIFSAFLIDDMNLAENEPWYIADDLFVESDEYDAFGYRKEDSVHEGGWGRNIKIPTQTGNTEKYSAYKKDVTDCHTASTLVSQLAYLMEVDESGIFAGEKHDDLVKLWYQSLRIGYDAKSTLVQVPQHLHEAAYMLWKGDAGKLEEINQLIDKVVEEIGLIPKEQVEFTVVDDKTDEPIRGASILGKHKFMIWNIKICEFADDKMSTDRGGKIYYDCIKQRYTFTVECIGYEPQIFEMDFSKGVNVDKKEIRLNRKSQEPTEDDDSAYYLHAGESLTLHNTASGWLNVLIWDYEVYEESEATTQYGNNDAVTSTTGIYKTPELMCDCEAGEPDKLVIRCVKGTVRVPKPKVGTWEAEVLEIK